CRLFRGSRIAVDAKHLRALARKGDGGRLAIAPAGPDRARAHHHRDFALEPFHRPLRCLIVVISYPDYGSLHARMVVTLAPTGCPRISDSVRQLPLSHNRHSPAAPELPSTT